MNINKLPAISILISLISLTGCLSESNTLNTDYSLLKQSSVSEKPLVSASNKAFSTYIKNGIRFRLAQSEYPIVYTDAAAEQSSDGNSGADDSGGFSTTNVHELGVDEADRLKYDGEYLYIVSKGDGSPEGIPTEIDTFPADRVVKNQIRILRTDNQSISAQEVSTIENETSNLTFSDIYLRPDSRQLIALSNTQLYAWDTSLPEDDWQWNSGKTEIHSYNIDNPATPSKQWKIEIEGNLQGSRRIADKLYLVTRYIPNIADLDYAASSDNAKQYNERLISNTPVSDLLPHYQSNNGAIRSLVSPESCLVSEDIDATHGYADIVTFTAIDLDDHTITSSICLNSNVQGIYSSTSGFYIGGTSIEPWLDYSNLTSIHKFGLNDGDIDYRASAALPGFLGWNDPAFRMDEFDDDLRIITSDFQSFESDPEHRLTILRENGSRQLQVVSTLPNETYPNPIGKPGEDIFSIRFTDERAYIVTFEQIDPLYVIDLNDPQSPKIAGELEIPGFSRYLHPIAQDWLLGIGNEVKQGQQIGVKVELYDIRNINQPIVNNTLVFGGPGSNSELLYNLRALSLLDSDAHNKKLAFPIDIWEQGPSNQRTWKESGLFAFDITHNDSGEYSLAYSGKLITESSNSDVNQQQYYPLNSGIGRSVIHNDVVYYLHGNEIFSSQWGAWDNKQGPF